MIPSGRIERPRVGVPLVDGRGEAAIGLRKSFDGGDRLRTGKSFAGLRTALRRGLPANLPSVIEREQRFVEPPGRSVEEQPSSPGCYVPQIVCMSFREPERKGFICKVRWARLFRLGRRFFDFAPIVSRGAFKPKAHGVASFGTQGVVDVWGIFHVASPSTKTSMPRPTSASASLRAPFCPTSSACARMVTVST